MHNTGKQNISDKAVIARKKDTFALAVLQSLPVGVIVFDKELKVINANLYASALVDVQSGADITLAKGTNEKIWGSWQNTLLGVLQYGKTCLFDNVNYRFAERQSLLQITCTPLADCSTDTIQGGIILL